MKKLMLSTAMIAAFSLPAIAQEGIFLGEPTAGSVRASELIGARIYASEAPVDSTEYNGVQEGWNDIGEVNDVILSREGSVQAVLVDIGGFLGMGERQAAIEMSALRFVSEAGTADNPDDWFLVLNANRALIEGAPEWKMGGAMMGTTNETGTTSTDGSSMAKPIMRDGYDKVASTDLTTEMLTGATAYDANDQSVGEVSDLVLGADGKITGAIIDVGGFLGMGEKPIEVKLDQVDILRQNGGSDLRIYVAMTKDQLETMPTYVK